ncbi:MAG TPA: hypothetical protein VGU03_03435 [Frateuria sp.]|uniref:hypothetical protein n=1 Tax=Frateuria sp. TaxID=2211372 RepID=UPI002DE6FE57|nr:hypothetical protein [Frateuria sp.]
MSRYARPEDIPADEQSDYEMLSRNNLMLFQKAERLGWREPTPEENAAYLKKVQNIKANQGG